MGIDHVIDVRRAVDLLDMLDQGLARCLGAAVVNNDFVSVRFAVPHGDRIAVFLTSSDMNEVDFVASHRPAPRGS